MAHLGTALIDPHKIFADIGLEKGMRVADLGCGRTGHFVFVAARAVGDTGAVYAVDVIKEVLDNIKSRCRTEGFENVQVIWSDIEAEGKTPIPPESLDMCFVVNVMFLIKKKESVLKEAKRLLKSGGKMIIVDWNKKIGPLGPDEQLMFKKESAKMVADKTGLSEIGGGPAGDYHYYLVLKKN